ncbi:MAG: DUF362 domain-containing protein [Firmicutes bacterium]|nr:DUF362 domain-containing protein [Bacillota bacterium]
MQPQLHVLHTDELSLGILRPILEQLPQPPKQARIAIKPNLVVPKPSTSGATTDPALVACIIEYLQEKGHTDIRILESSGVGNSTQHAFRSCGYEKISKAFNVPLVDLKGDQATKLSTHGLDLEICQEVLESDFLINVPVLKAHCQTRLTCALKNLKGCIPDREKRRFHTLGLHRPIAALNTILKSNWIIVDGLIGDLTFEEGGTPIHMGKIILGDDPVAVDAYALELLGYELHDVPYVSMAAAWKVGTADLSGIDVAEHVHGDRPPVVPQPANRVAERYQPFIDEREACSACYASLIYALRRYEQLHGALPHNLRLSIGQGFSSGTQTSFQEESYGIGRCTADLCSRHVPGCPPTAKQILTKLEAWLESNR